MRHASRRLLAIISFAAIAAAGLVARQTPQTPPGNQTLVPGTNQPPPTGLVLGTVVDATTGRPVPGSALIFCATM